MEDARPGEDALVPVEVRPVLHGQREVLAPLGHVADHRLHALLRLLAAVRVREHPRPTLLVVAARRLCGAGLCGAILKFDPGGYPLCC